MQDIRICKNIQNTCELNFLYKRLNWLQNNKNFPRRAPGKTNTHILQSSILMDTEKVL
jgi:hypothetical protein